MSRITVLKFQPSALHFIRKRCSLSPIFLSGLSFLSLFLGLLSPNLFAQEDVFSIPASAEALKKQEVNLNVLSPPNTGVTSDTLPISIQNIRGLAITATFGLRFIRPSGFLPDDPSAFVRVILIDSSTQQEYLVYQKSYQDLTSEEYNTPEQLKINAVCQETCVLPEMGSALLLKAEAQHAGITISEISYVDTPLEVDAATLRKKQNDLIIEKLNEQDLGWIAGETSVSNLTYEEKKRLVNLTDPSEELNLQGFEYYRGGIFEIKSKDATSETRKGTRQSALVDQFDWRNRHGENWVTSVKQQGHCGSCYIFSTTSVLEAITNLYFNQHLDLDLSEQNIVSCGKGSQGINGCGGGVAPRVFDYFQGYGTIDEACFPYSASDNSCSNKCNTPNEQINTTGKAVIESDFLRSVDDIKRMIVEYGPINGGINSMKHAMMLVGFKTDPKDGRTIWIFKNSWGKEWGSSRGGVKEDEHNWGRYQNQGANENGFAYVKLDLDNISDNTSVLKTPIISAKSRQISCVDKDHDNYCNWGISKDKPSTCPTSCKSEKDCDDSDAQRGPFDAQYNCSLVNNAPDPQPPIAGFTISPAKGEAPLKVTLDASTSKDPDGTITTYDWSQVKANAYATPTSITSSSNPIVTHTFETAGQFEVILAITDAQGLRSEEHKVVTVTGDNQNQLFDLEAVEGSTFAWDESGQPTKSGAVLKGGISVAGGPYLKLVKFSDNLGHGGQAQSVQIKGSIEPDPKHDGKVADIFVFGEFVNYGEQDLNEQTCPPDSSVKTPAFYAMKGSPKNDTDAKKPRNYVLWGGTKTPSTVPILYEGVTLKSGQEQQFTLFEGPFDAKGCLSISFGYRLKDSAMVVYNHHTATVNNMIGVTVRKK